MGCEYINSQKLDNYLRNKDAIIIDLRDSKDYAIKHIKGAFNVSYETMEQAISNLRYNGNILKCQEVSGDNIIIGRNTIIIMYCDRGASSMRLCAKLGRQGFMVKTLLGGILRYNGRYMI